MRAESIPKLSKWPFFIAAALLLGLAAFICVWKKDGISPAELSLAVGAVLAGMVLWVVPFLLEYRALSNLAEATLLGEVTERLRGIEQLASQINVATGTWQGVQDQADKTAAGARNIAERMAAEARGFREFIQRSNDQEKATLRLEVEKLRRAEAEWVQVLVRMMDHVYALHQGALRSGQANVMEQVGNFQNACRDAARRVGLTPIVANRAEPYDGQRHQLADEKARATGAARIAETLAAGYTFQGKVLRPALVRLENGND
jgi:molecular chaperone GrpE (heat shock protein)